MKHEKIFVLLASYRDCECEKTINELFDKASKPENISVGICWQYSEEDNFRCFNPDMRFADAIRITHIPYQETKGVCWARRIAQEFWDGEEYTLIIDSHMLFEHNWDQHFIGELKKCPSARPVLSHYPAGYELPEIKSQVPPVINAAHSRTNRFRSCCFVSNYNIRGNMFLFDANYELQEPIRGFFYAAGFAFGPSQFLQEVPYDPCLDWEEEEIAISLKLWTHGWDIFAPQKHYIYHLYHTEKTPDTPDFRKAVHKKELERRALVSKKRFYHLLGILPTDDAEALQDINMYALGGQRSIDDFEMAAGVNLKNSLTTERSIDCWFALEHPSHPLKNEKQSLEKIFTQKFLAEAEKGRQSVSGEGSTLQATENLRNSLTAVLAQYKVKTILDLGCGDFNWFNGMLDSIHVDRYHGIDIVAALIEENKKKYRHSTCSFGQADITSSSLGAYDLVLIRDVLTHLKVRNVIKVLTNIKNSESHYFAASHYSGCDRNRDLQKNGGWHSINLQIPPYTLPAPLEIIDDIPEKGKYLALWRTCDIPDFSNTAMKIEAVNEEQSVFTIKKHLSRDESEYLASVKYYRFIDDNKFSIATGTDDPIIQRIFKRTKLFAANNRYHKAYIIECDNSDFNALNSIMENLREHTALFITLLSSGKQGVVIQFAEDKSSVPVNQGECLAFSNSLDDLRVLQISAGDHAHARLLIQLFGTDSIEAENSAQFKPLDDTIVLNAAGDLMLARDMHRYYPRYSAKNILHDVYSILAEGDINLCNLETVISNEGTMQPKGENNPYYFRACTTLAPFLADSNFNVATTGNNHAMDFGEKALKFQADYLNSIHIAHCGSGMNITEAGKPVYLAMNGTIICIISFCSVRPKNSGATEQSAGVFQINDPASISSILAPIVQEARKKAHLIIVSPHWIENWEENPGAVIQSEAKKLIDMGCDAILGHSSHLLHGIEIYKNRPIIYDMGCFLLDRTHGHKDLGLSALFQLLIKNNVITDLRIFPLSLKNGSVNLADEEDSKRIFRKLSSIDSAHELSTKTSRNHFSFAFERRLPHSPSEKITDSVDICEKGKKMPTVDLSTDLAFASAPSWHTGFQEVTMGKTAIVNAQLPESVGVGSGFVIKTVIRTGLKIENYEVVIRGVSHTFNNTFQEVHLFSDGAINSTIANNRPFLMDYHFVRLHPNIQPGRYKIFWSLRQIETRQPLLTEKGEDSVFLGSMHILPEVLPLKASGIDWDGNLPKELRDNFAKEFTETPETGVFEFIFNKITDKQQHQSGLSFFAYEQKYRISPGKHFVYLTISNKDHSIRWGCTRKDLKTAVARNIDKICGRNDFQTVLQSGDENITLKLEIIIAEAKIDPKEQQTANMACRGLKLERDDRSYILLPSEAYDKKILSFEQQFAHLIALHNIDSPDDYSCYLLESIGHAFYQGCVSGHYE